MSDDLEALLREHYRRAAEDIRPDADLVTRYRNAARPRIARAWPRVLLAAAAVAVVVLLAWGLLRPGGRAVPVAPPATPGTGSPVPVPPRPVRTSPSGVPAPTRTATALPSKAPPRVRAPSGMPPVPVRTAPPSRSVPAPSPTRTTAAR